MLFYQFNATTAFILSGYVTLIVIPPHNRILTNCTLAKQLVNTNKWSNCKHQTDVFKARTDISLPYARRHAPQVQAGWFKWDFDAIIRIKRLEISCVEMRRPDVLKNLHLLCCVACSTSFFSSRSVYLMSQLSTSATPWNRPCVTARMTMWILICDQAERQEGGVVRESDDLAEDVKFD